MQREAEGIFCTSRLGDLSRGEGDCFPKKRFLGWFSPSPSSHRAPRSAPRRGNSGRRLPGQPELLVLLLLRRKAPGRTVPTFSHPLPGYLPPAWGLSSALPCLSRARLHREREGRCFLQEGFYFFGEGGEKRGGGRIERKKKPKKP